MEKQNQVIKTSLSRVKWKEKYVQPLDDLVQKTNRVVVNTYQFAKYAFINEKMRDPAFDLRPFICESFFAEVFMSFTTRKERITETTPADKREFKAFIARHLASFRETADCPLEEITNAQQSSQYEGGKIATSYLNNVQERFGKHWTRFINCLADSRNLEKPAKKTLGQLKRLAAASDPQYTSDICIDRKMVMVTEHLQRIRETYPPGYQFGKDSIHYDVKAKPLEHINAFYMLGALCEINGFKGFHVFPLRTTFIPCHMQICTKILRSRILDKEDRKALEVEEKATTALGEKMRVWEKVLNIRGSIFKDRGCSFQGTIQTDGVSISVIKQNHPSGRCQKKVEGAPKKKTKGKAKNKSTVEKAGAKGKKRKRSEGEDNAEEYDLDEGDGEPGVKDLVEDDLKKLVLIDPGRRDLLYCMKYTSTPEEKEVYRYTANQCAKETKARRYKKLRENIKPAKAQEAETMLSKFPLRTIDPKSFDKYLKARAGVKDLLFSYYANENASPLFRKLKLSSYIRNQQSEALLAKNLRKNFGDDAKLVMGNWSGAHQRYHAPQKGIGMRKMLRKQGFDVTVIDEFKSSMICPCCHKESLENFQVRPNPRPYQRRKKPTVVVHGLLRCTTEDCLEAKDRTRRRLWNRDLVATLNFRHIINGHVFDGRRPERFCRKKSKDDESNNQLSESVIADP